MDNIQHLKDREYVIESLIRNVCGPNPLGSKRSLEDTFHWSDFPIRQENNEEVIFLNSPNNKYGTGILYPKNIIATEINDEKSNEDQVNDFDEFKHKIKINSKNNIKSEDLDTDFDIKSTSKLLQSSYGVSICVEIEKLKHVKVAMPLKKKLLTSSEIEVNGIYRQKKITIKDDDGVYERDAYLRFPFCKTDLVIDVDVETLKSRAVFKYNFEDDLDGHNKLSLCVYPRFLTNTDSSMILTFCIINEVSDDSPLNSPLKSLYQSYFEIDIESFAGDGGILPYPSYKESYEEEEFSMQLLYRDSHIFGIGHGCSAVWDDKTVKNGRLRKISSEFIPIFQDQTMTANIPIPELNISMYELISDNGIEKLSIMFDAYEKWICQQEEKSETLDKEHKQTLHRHILKCKESLKRMKEGLNWIKSDKKAKKSFMMMNKAMVMQRFLGNQLGDVRETYSHINGRIFKPDSPGHQNLDGINKEDLDKWCWRPFQIAFILMSLKSSVDGSDPFRECVDLIWFPTGGGKTEAYLGLSAFSIFYRRINCKDDTGTQILMRYTLRLLTTQQFQRASRLICAMELIRKENVDILGIDEFKIGIWVGLKNSPNSRKEARQNLKETTRGNNSLNNPNSFILQSCPWCGASFHEKEKNKSNYGPKSKFIGCEEHRRTVVYNCPDRRCSFSGPGKLPIFVIDEDIFEVKPDIIIGTVDKFARLIWDPKVRSIFGYDDNGHRVTSPPGLIIQDELHLISGPLGSMCGFFETIIEELCTDRREKDPVKPKIVCSTATIRRYEEQVNNLFSRKNVNLFPSSGSTYNDSFFAVVDENTPGRIHVGLSLAGYSSMVTAQTRVFTILLRSALKFSDDVTRQDPWWTLLIFYNSLIELGTGLTLFQSDVREQDKVLSKESGIPKRRWLNHINELTSRLESNEITEALEKLQKKLDKDKEKSNKNVVDACLASSIIEVGIDVERLCSMVMVGQPKTTSQYIQVAGRVGRRNPGVVFLLYNPLKTRDKSHFETFYSYHKKLNTYVEPTSVTPFSPPILERSLHALLVAGIRQLGDLRLVNNPSQIPHELIDRVRELIEKKAFDLIESDNDKDHFNYMMDKRIYQLKNRRKTIWDNWQNPGQNAMLYNSGNYIEKKYRKTTWPTQNSMRNVDATCEGEITSFYDELDMEKYEEENEL